MSRISVPRIEAVDAASRGAFVEWALAHGAEHDESYTQPPDLEAFPGDAEVAVLAFGAEGEVVGAASLMVEGFRREDLGRFRILHAIEPAAYEPMVHWVVQRAPGDVSHVFAFLPEGAEAAGVLTEVGFAPTRYAVILERAPVGGSDAHLAADVPSGVMIRPACVGDAAAWADVANAAFCGYPGRYDMTEERAAALLGDERVVPAGSLLAVREGRPIGLVSVWRDEAPGTRIAEIASLAVVPDAQGLGIGRALLRAGVARARDTGYDRVSLSTSTTNAPALSLYTSEGFEVVEVRVCWGKDL